MRAKNVGMGRWCGRVMFACEKSSNLRNTPPHLLRVSLLVSCACEKNSLRSVLSKETKTNDCQLTHPPDYRVGLHADTYFGSTGAREDACRGTATKFCEYVREQRIESVQGFNLCSPENAKLRNYHRNIHNRLARRS